MGLAPSTRGGHDTPTAGDGDTGLEENPFADDDFVMGVPEKGTSTGTIVLIAVVAVVLIGVGLFFALGG
jgi:hypothetical protein